MFTVIVTAALCILSLVLLLLLCVCFLSAKLTIRMENSRAQLRLSFFGITLYRYPEKKKLQKAPEKAKKSSQNDNRSLLSLPQGLEPDKIFSLLRALFHELNCLFGYTKATLYDLSLTPPPAEEAAAAALWHTGASAGAAAFLELLDRSTKLKIHSRDAVCIRANFTQEKAAFSLHLTLSVKGYRALLTLGSLGKRIEEIQN